MWLLGSARYGTQFEATLFHANLVPARHARYFKTIGKYRRERAEDIGSMQGTPEAEYKRGSVGRGAGAIAVASLSVNVLGGEGARWMRACFREDRCRTARELLTASCVSLGGIPRIIVDVGDVPEIPCNQREKRGRAPSAFRIVSFRFVSGFYLHPVAPHLHSTFLSYSVAL